MSKFKENKKDKNVFSKNDEVKDFNERFGDKMGFDGSETFNLLRTNLIYSFMDDKKCHVVAVSSPLPGSGKSLVSANLAYSIAKMSKKVLLIDGDLRLPTLYKKLNINQKPGLSNILVSVGKAHEIIQHYNNYLDVISAGDIPPKPSELLGSDRMKRLLDVLAEVYEYIIIDSPPITVVPDTLAMAKFLDGIILVVRKDHDEKNAVSDTLRQLELAKAKLLGFVFNNGEDDKSSKSYKYGYRQYGYGKSRYGYKKYKSAAEANTEKS